MQVLLVELLSGLKPEIRNLYSGTYAPARPRGRFMQVTAALEGRNGLLSAVVAYLKFLVCQGSKSRP